MTFYAVYGRERGAAAPVLLFDFPQGEDTDMQMVAFVADVAEELELGGVSEVRVEKHEV